MRDVVVPRSTPGDSQWFREARFGMFVHWGISAVSGRDMWLKSQERIADDDYDRRYFDHFDPDLYDPQAWAAAAAAAGVRYAVVTAKHHDGFCLWDTQHGDYSAPHTPARRDLLRPFLDAFRAEGMRVGVYYSLLDWHHPDFLVDRYHPRRGQQPWGTTAEGEALNTTRDMSVYVAYAHRQVHELLTEYGDIDILWPDFSYEGKSAADWQASALIGHARHLRPGLLVNDRCGVQADLYDVTTPEQVVPPSWPEVNGVPALWETCHTMNGQWGYTRDTTKWRSVAQLVENLVDAVSKGGNFLLNVGPTARGEFDEPSLERLRGIGRWMAKHERSIVGCTQAPAEFIAPEGTRLTYSPERDRLYVHVLRWPDTGWLELPGMAGQVRFARLVHDDSELQLTTPNAMFVNDEERFLDDDSQLLALPFHRPDVAVPVIDVELS